MATVGSVYTIICITAHQWIIFVSKHALYNYTVYIITVLAVKQSVAVDLSSCITNSWTHYQNIGEYSLWQKILECIGSYPSILEFRNLTMITSKSD